MDKINMFLVAGMVGVAMLLLPDNVFRKPEPPMVIRPDDVALATDSDKRYLSALAELSQSHILAGKRQLVSMRLRIQAPAAERGKIPPSDVVVVLDRSGSMEAEDRIGFARKALVEASKRMRPEDRMAIVTFASDVSMLRGLAPVTDGGNRQCAGSLSTFALAQKIVAGGGTFLSGGLGAAADILAQSPPGRSRQIFLVSDGQANEGIQGEDLARYGQELGQKGIMITALGVGTDYDAQTFIHLADGTGGGYAYVTMGERIPAAVRGELARAGGRIINNMKVNVELAPGVRFVRALKYIARASTGNVPAHAGKVEILCPNVAAEEQKDIVLELEIDPGLIQPDQNSRIQVARATITYARTDGEGTTEALNLKVGATVTQSEKLVRASINSDVAAQRETLDADLSWAASSVNVAAGNYDLAAKQMRERACALEEANRDLKSSSVAAKIQEMLTSVNELEHRTFFGGTAGRMATMGANQAALSGGIY